VLVLLAQYNLLAAALVGTAFAGLGGLLSGMGMLPSICLFGNSFEMPWSMLFGQLGLVPMLILWQSQDRVFLDKACISQTNSEKKKRGIESIGAILGLSKNLLVLWDQGYLKRLWCVFELAAYVKAKGQCMDKGSLTVRPISWGYMWAALYVGNSLMAFWYWACADAQNVPLIGGGFFLCLMVSMHIMRSMQRLVSTLKEQLTAFSFSGAECYCCSVQHCDLVTGEQVLCDRKCVLGCIVAWFGSVEGFETFVRNDLYKHFKGQLGKPGLPYLWVLSACLPYVWMVFDAVAGGHRAGDLELTLGWKAAEAMATSATMITTTPLLVGLLLLVARMTQRQHQTASVNLLLTLGASALVAGASLLVRILVNEARVHGPCWLALPLQVLLSLGATAAIFQS